jgi:hypothetical protein
MWLSTHLLQFWLSPTAACGLAAYTVKSNHQHVCNYVSRRTRRRRCDVATPAPLSSLLLAAALPLPPVASAASATADFAGNHTKLHSTRTTMATLREDRKHGYQVAP